MGTLYLLLIFEKNKNDFKKKVEKSNKSARGLLTLLVPSLMLIPYPLPLHCTPPLTLYLLLIFEKKIKMIFKKSRKVKQKCKRAAQCSPFLFLSDAHPFSPAPTLYPSSHLVSTFNI